MLLPVNQYSTKFVMDPPCALSTDAGHPSLYPYTWSVQAQVMPHAGQLANVLTAEATDTPRCTRADERALAVPVLFACVYDQDGQHAHA